MPPHREVLQSPLLLILQMNAVSNELKRTTRHSWALYCALAAGSWIYMAALRNQHVVQLNFERQEV